MDTLGVILLATGENVEALDLLRRAHNKNPTGPISFHLAQALLANGAKADARRVLEKLVASTTKFEERREAEALLSRLR